MDYANWICSECGHLYGEYPKGHISSWHTGECDWCHKIDIPVTEPRDFKYPSLPGEN